MYSTADYSVTPRPMYPADGRKMPDVYTHPGNAARRAAGGARHVSAVRVLGTAGVDQVAREWIAAAAKQVEQQHNPTLTLVYLPHLDYNLQRLGLVVAAIEVTCARSTMSPAI